MTGYTVAPFLDGSIIDSKSDRLIEVMNPSTGRLCLRFGAGSDADADRAVASARRAFDDGRWSDAPPSLRKKTLHRFADLIDANATELDALSSLRKKTLHRFADLIDANATELDALDAEEMGKPIQEGFANAMAAAGLMRFQAEAIDKLMGDVYSSDKTSLVLQRLTPRGVVASLSSWNFPTFVAVLKIASALAAGNCVVLKPSEQASRSAMRLAQLAIEAGLPPGVLNVVPGLGTTVGRALALHRGVDMLTFTGSTAVGKLLLEYSGQSNMKVVMAECGGKSPQIVFADGVDLDVAGDRIARSLLANQGQVCTMGSRVLVHKSIERELIEKICARARQIVMGDARDSRTTFGPVASASHCSRIERYINGARDSGAELVLGGRRALIDSGGFFIEPTIFRAVSAASPLVQEEIFGPVLSVLTFEDEAEAIRLANDTIYGLIAYVWTANLSTGLRMMKGIRSTVRINAVAPQGEGSGYAASYEPANQSGVGVESGMTGILSYMRRQLVSFSHV